MGARVALADDQTQFGVVTKVVVTVDDEGNELARGEVAGEPALLLSVVQFVDLDDGRRVTTEALGDISLSIPRASTLDELWADVREVIFEDELRDTDEELADEPQWEDMASVLRQRGIVADDAALLALPFVVELDEGAVAGLRGSG